MKTNDFDREPRPICAVWKNSPADTKSMHTRILVPVRTPQGKVDVCTKCHQDIRDVVAFMERKSIGPKESLMTRTKVELRSKKEIVKNLDSTTKNGRQRESSTRPIPPVL